MKFQQKILFTVCCLQFAIFSPLLWRGVGGVASAQEYPDAGLWTTFNVEKALNTRFTGLFTQECRLKENFSRLNLFYTNLGIEYKFSRSFKAAFIYRHIDKYLDDNTFSYRHRLMLDITWKTKFGKFGFSYRKRMQAEERNIFSSENGKLPEWYSRNKISLKYDSGKSWTPYVSAEFRYQFHDPRKLESDGTWHRGRYVFGIDYKKNDKSTFGFYYLVQHEFNVLSPQDQYIIGLEYTLSL